MPRTTNSQAPDQKNSDDELRSPLRGREELDPDDRKVDEDREQRVGRDDDDDVEVDREQRVSRRPGNEAEDEELAEEDILDEEIDLDEMERGDGPDA